ncbi:9063_t:CDS:10 [Gigaspora margarita]|uniref:Chloride channel protein n=1 Tax=Gigaspora margarita TaxID=4874 RepID=A0ABN7UST7_GIGMA|nr:9063_t:CDS:10 [Gigaspora margarita]
MASENRREENLNKQNDDGIPKVNVTINDEPIKRPHRRTLNRFLTLPDFENGKDLDNIFETPSEDTALLSGEPFHNYGHLPTQSSLSESNHSVSGVRRPRPGFNKRHTWAASIKAIADPVRRYTSRSGAYDDDGLAIVREGGGIRVWYDDYTTIDWIHDYVKERVRVRKLHSIRGARGNFLRLCDSSEGWILVFLIGVVTACIAGAVDSAVEWGSDLKDGYCSSHIFDNKHFCCKYTKGNDSENCNDWVNWSEAFDVHMMYNKDINLFDYFAYVFVAVASAALLVKYNSLYASPSSKSSSKITTNNHTYRKKEAKLYAAGSGIPEVKTILSGFVIRGFLGIRTLWVKALTLAMVVAAGMTLGKEGPFVHIACCIGNILSRLFTKYNKNEGKRREILSASAAAGVSVAFAAPIGGVLFSLEELINPFGSGKIVMFQVTYDNEWHVFEIISFLILGVLGGFLGAVLCELITMYTKYVRNRTWLKSYPVVEVIIVVIITATVNYVNKYTKMSNTDLVHFLFNECTDESLDAGLCATYPESPIFTSVCDPSKMNDCVNPGVYAMVGAAACLAGVTRMTVSLTVIMFELTGALTYILPIMTAIMIAKWVADGIVKHGIYDLLITLNDHPFLDSKAEYITTATTLDLCQNDTEVIDVNSRNTINDLKIKLKRLSNSDSGFPIVDGPKLVGYIAANELEHAIKHVEDAEALPGSTECQFRKAENEITIPNAYTDQAPLTVSKNASLEVVLELFKKLGLRYICVVNCGEYVGVIHKKQLLVYLRNLGNQNSS